MEKENKKKGFHHMEIEFTPPIEFIQPRHMTIEMDLVATKFNHRC